MYALQPKKSFFLCHSHLALNFTHLHSTLLYKNARLTIDLYCCYSNNSGSLQHVATILSKLAEEAGAPPGVEYIQSRDIEKTILLGMPGTLSRIASGDFPPPPPPRWKTSEEMAAEKAESEL